MSNSSEFARTPAPPYYAVVFTALLRDQDDPGYADMAVEMVELASTQAGFLGFESARGADGFGISVSYWSSRKAIAAWKANSDHRAAQARGISNWYVHYELRIARVERAYGMVRPTVAESGS